MKTIYLKTLPDSNYVRPWFRSVRSIQGHQSAMHLVNFGTNTDISILQIEQIYSKQKWRYKQYSL